MGLDICKHCEEPLVVVGFDDHVGQRLVTCGCTTRRNPHREATDPRKKGTCVRCGRLLSHPRCIT